MAQLRAEVEYFPLYDIGVAQGCALSPLIGNILLTDFDGLLNTREIVCLRYIDDFILFGRDPRSVRKAFDAGRILLDQLGLKVYDPQEVPTKAVSGKASDGFEFLGCHIRPGMIQPSRDSRTKLHKRILRIVNDGVRNLELTAVGHSAYTTLTRTLFDLDNVLRGWGESYSFCNDVEVLRALDQYVDPHIDRWISNVVSSSEAR